MTSIIRVQNIQYTDGDSAITIADGGGITLPQTVTVSGNIELGHATDTTLSRSAAGTLQVEGKTVLTTGHAGAVLQTIQSVKLDTFQGQASTLTDIDGTDESGSGSIFECNITPSSSSNKVLIFMSMAITATDAGTGVSLIRGSTEIYKGAAASSRVRLTIGPLYGSGSANNVYSAPVSTAVFLDSPGVTSEVTYKPQYFSRGSSNFNLGFTIYDTDNDNATRVPASITLMEIAG